MLRIYSSFSSAAHHQGFTVPKLGTYCCRGLFEEARQCQRDLTLYPQSWRFRCLNLLGGCPAPATLSQHEQCDSNKWCVHQQHLRRNAYRSFRKWTNGDDVLSALVRRQLKSCMRKLPATIQNGRKGQE